MSGHEAGEFRDRHGALWQASARALVEPAAFPVVTGPGLDLHEALAAVPSGRAIPPLSADTAGTGKKDGTGLEREKLRTMEWIIMAGRRR
ncbi:hypothetical protein [Azospirillum sp. B506]|uniref:hypothetical protein n=1 Tax=Azospirillum sp. B506 TaxID=137721 RepID=UPI000344D8EB|nr:hypothetical protein [Azospirillum sp. B506]